MQQASSIEDFLAAPSGKWVAGKSFVVWVLSPTLAGSIYFGRPNQDDFPALMQLMPLPLSDAFSPPFDVVIDCTRLEGLSASSFELLVGYLGEVGGSSGVTARIRRAAVVRPSNMTGATLGGLFYELVQTRFRAALFTDPIEAHRWLGREGGDEEHRVVAEALVPVLEEPAFLRSLRDWLASHLDGATVAAAALALGSSPRSMQRYLQQANTNFRAEIDRARVRVAEALLIDDDQKLEAIAHRVGCASLSHFSTLFRRTTGEAPSDFRSRRR